MNRLFLGALALGAALVAAPGLAGANLLQNGSFAITNQVVGGTSGYPTTQPTGTSGVTGLPFWAASAWNPLGGAVGTGCFSPLFGFATCLTRDSFARVEDALPQGNLPNPSALYQTVTLAPGAYRFGGDFALAVDGASIFNNRVDNESEAFLRIYGGPIVFTAAGVPTVAGATLLASINLSPGQFDADDFSLSNGVIKARQFAAFEGVFELTGSDPVDVTMQLVVLPKRAEVPPSPPYLNNYSAALIQATALIVFADNLFLERTRLKPQPVPAPGALGLFAMALAGLVAVRRRKAA